jgi:hypothetical protein
MIPCLVRISDGECLGQCDVDPDGNSPQAPGNADWEVVELPRTPKRATEKVIDGEIVHKTAEEIAAQEKKAADEIILNIANLPPTDLVRVTYDALWKLDKATGEIPESTTFEEYLQGLVDSS